MPKRIAVNPDSANGNSPITSIIGDADTIELDGDNSESANDDSGAESDATGSGTEYTDPSSAGSNSSTSAGSGTGKRRGRKPGSRNKSAGGKASATQATNDISGILFTAHLFIAKAVKMDLLEITKEESEELGGAITRVTELYEIPLLSPKHMAFVNLAMVMGNVYGSRLIVASLQKKQAAKVVDMPFDISQATHVSNL